MSTPKEIEVLLRPVLQDRDSDISNGPHDGGRPVDLPRQRIALSMKSNPGQPRRQPKAQGAETPPQRRPQQKRQDKGRQPKPEPTPQTALGRAFANLQSDDDRK